MILGASVQKRADTGSQGNERTGRSFALFQALEESFSVTQSRLISSEPLRNDLFLIYILSDTPTLKHTS